jgi:ATP-dependent Clp protease ATP-binding subunit ClpB
MDFDKFTEKSKSVLQKAQTLAMRSNHPSLEPEHLLKVMLEDEDALTERLVQASGGQPALMKKAAETAIARLPVVTGSGSGGLRISTDLSKTLDNALQIAEKAGDKYVTVERIFQAMVMAPRASEMGAIMADSGLTPGSVNQAINTIRKGRTADSATAEDQFEALAKYARDLTKDARDGKLDPIIGRDEEIRRTIQILSRRTKNNPVLIGEPG